MKVVVLVLYTENWQSLADVTIPNTQRYCDKHGYELRAIKHSEPYESDFGYMKLTASMNMFANDEADIILNLDLDCLITNHEIKIESLVDFKNSLFISKDYNGINAGSFILTDTKEVYSLLAWCIERHGIDKMYCEQDAIRWVYENKHPNFIKIIPQNKSNSYLYQYYPEIPLQTHEQGQWQPCDFVLHLHGLPFEKRIEIFNEIKTVIRL